MRTDSPSSPSSPVARLQAEFARTRRRLAERAPGWTRRLAARLRGQWPIVILAATVLAVLGLLSFGSMSSATPSVSFLRQGERFSRDNLESIRRALDAKHVSYRIDDGRIEVAADHLDDASDVVAKLAIGPRSLTDIDKESLEWGVLDPPALRELRLQQAHNERIAAMIRRIDGITGAWVKIDHPQRKLNARTTPGATAFVYLETQDDREISSSTVQNIVGLVSTFDPEVRQDAVTIFDAKGRRIAVAHDPAATAQTRDRARAEELKTEIESKLDWIKGVQVSVRLVPATPYPTPVPVPAAAGSGAPMVAPPPAPLPVPLSSLPPLPPEPPPPAAPAEEVHRPPTAVAVNQPIELGSESPAPATTVPAPAQTPTPRPASPRPPAETAHEHERQPDHEPGGVAASPEPPPATQAQVLVRVPRSYYVNSCPRTVPGREPSREELLALVSRTETAINVAVRHVVGLAQLGEVNVSTIPDDPPTPLPLLLTAGEARRTSWWWIMGGVATGAGISLAGVLVWLAAARQPSLRPTARGDRGRYKIDEAAAAGPGPTERVRELIRLNPEAAASVLHRWTGQGGPDA